MGFVKVPGWGVGWGRSLLVKVPEERKEEEGNLLALRHALDSPRLPLVLCGSLAMWLLTGWAAPACNACDATATTATRDRGWDHLSVVTGAGLLGVTHGNR